MQHTARSCFSRSLARITQWCRAHRHCPVCEQHQALSQKLRGHYGYFGLTGNFERLRCFLDEVRRIWRKWLARRSHRAAMTWARFQQLTSTRYALPRAEVVHSIYRAANP